MEEESKRLNTLAVFTFLLSPVLLLCGIFFDDKSYIIASAVSELYFLTMMSVIGYLCCYLAYRNWKVSNKENSL